jgi:hypothetical protein
VHGDYPGPHLPTALTVPPDYATIQPRFQGHTKAELVLFGEHEEFTIRVDKDGVTTNEVVEGLQLRKDYNVVRGMVLGNGTEA